MVGVAVQSCLTTLHAWKRPALEVPRVRRTHLCQCQLVTRLLQEDAFCSKIAFNTQPRIASRVARQTRPAGSEGFCLVNNVAVAARYALAKYPKEVRRVMILDWDVHHGQGTQEIFWRDGHVLTVSCHAHAERFYPQSGRPEEVGEDAGRGYNVNVALPAGYTDACLQHAFAEVVLPALRSFAPDLVLVSCGFDHLAGDPLGVGQCSAEGLARLAAE
ncbi:unnamed protein product, partial [Effrenium voratum]